MKQFNIEIDKTSPKTRQFTLPAYEHFSILVQYKNWEDRQEWLDYTLADQAGADIVKYKKELESNCVLYFCSYMSASGALHFKSSTDSPAPRDTIQIVALPSSTQDNCYICSADYARTAGEGGGGGGGVSQEYVDNKVQEEADARDAAIKALSLDIPTKISQLSNDSGYLTKAGTIDNALSAGFASYVPWSGVQNKQIASATELGLIKVGSNLTIDSEGTLNAVGGTSGVSQEYVDNKVQDEATARQNADEAIESKIPTKISQLSNDSGFLTKTGTIDNALSADFASSIGWNGIADKPIASATELGLVKVGSNLTIDADGKLNAVGGTGGVSQEYVDGKVQDEATARAAADEELRAAIPTKTSQLSNDSGYLTYGDTISNADSANTANNVNWSGVQSKPTTVSGYGITDAATIKYVDSQIGNVLTQEEF